MKKKMKSVYVFRGDLSNIYNTFQPLIFCQFYVKVWSGASNQLFFVLTADFFFVSIFYLGKYLVKK